jgi:hypothetical protein
LSFNPALSHYSIAFRLPKSQYNPKENAMNAEELVTIEELEPKIAPQSVADILD